MEDAREAAGALAERGVARVLLYGSLARGEQSNGSDIDLVAIYDDMDRSKVSRDVLCKEAQAAAGCEAEVEVFITDRPEWAHRARHVPSSFEAHIAPSAVVLCDRPAPAGAVRWDKEISRPCDDRSEGEDRLKRAASIVGGLGTSLRRLELTAARQDDRWTKISKWLPFGRRGDRLALEREETRREESFQIYQLTRICQDSSNAARLSMGAVCALEGRYPRRDLNVAQLGDSLGAEHQEVAAAGRRVDAVEVERWQGICPSCLDYIFPSDELSLHEEVERASGLIGPTFDLFDAAVAAFEATGDEASHAKLADKIAWGRNESGTIRSQLHELGLAVRR